AAVLANYNVTNARADYTINKAHLTVTADNKSKTYDGHIFTAFTATLSGFVNGDASSVVTGSAAFTGDAVGAVNAGTNTITPTSGMLSAANYDFPAANFVNGTLTIHKADAAVVVTPYNVAYDGHVHTAAVTSITGVNGETGVTVGTVDASNTSHTPAGTYATDSWSFTGTANYNDIAATTITDKINKANATVVVTPYDVTYDGHAHTAAITSISGVN